LDDDGDGGGGDGLIVMVRVRKGNNKDPKWCGTAWWCWRWHVRQRKRGNALRSL